MFKLREKFFVSIILILFSSFLYAQPKEQRTTGLAPMFNEENGLIETAPKQVKALALAYLSQRTLLTKPTSKVTRDELDRRTRTLNSSVYVLKALALAEFNLGNINDAMAALTQAKDLTEKYQLLDLSFEVRLLSIRLQWLDSQDHSQIKNSLNALQQDYLSTKHTKDNIQPLDYKIKLFQAEIASREGLIYIANQFFSELEHYVKTSTSALTPINFHLIRGKHYLDHNLHSMALSELLTAYWSAIETNSSALLAKSNMLLAALFVEHRFLDKALIHLSEAADFYDNHQDSPQLTEVLHRMGNIYFKQGKFNLALVHYLNEIGHASNHYPIDKAIRVRLYLAKTYLQLYNLPLAEQYLARSDQLLASTNYPRLNAESHLLNAEIAFHQGHDQLVVDHAEQAITIAKMIGDVEIEEQAYQQLSLGYEQMEQYALSINAMKRYNTLFQRRQTKFNQISEDSFRAQKEFVEQKFYLTRQENTLHKTQKNYIASKRISVILFVIVLILLLVLARYNNIAQRQKKEIKRLTHSIFTHSRSNLRNLKMLNEKLAFSLKRSSDHYEQWHVGDLIHEPLNDRLRFAMIDVPFLRNMYLQHGYSAGLALERQFGEFLNQKIVEPARIYHFSDANLLYIEPNMSRDDDPQILFDQFQSWIFEFQSQQTLNRVIRMGIADYPFLPKAYTAINDKELLDILFMATNSARTLSMKASLSQWVFLQAIDNAPAASFISDDIRETCKHAIEQGLVKIHSSHSNEEEIKTSL